ncbi:MAG: LuxR C-terminal-related transcriptional regulator [Chloroflexota bacterium]|nr:LuxR C-terminal-related transcriptional regulator [Chloroflexota bacterium]
MKKRAETSQTRGRRVQRRRLTDRQTAVLELVAQGLENKEIAHRIGLSEQAVKEHVSALLRRLAVRNRAALAEIATELKIAGTMDLRPEWLSYIYEQSAVASAVIRGPEHIFVSANNAYRRTAGVGEIVGRSLVDVFPLVSPRTLALLDEVIATGEPKVIHEMPGHFRGSSKEDGYADVVFQPLPGAEAGLIISGVDVTDQVRARQSLAELSAEQLALLDLVPSAIVVLDHRGAVAKVNRAAQTLLGDEPFKEVDALAPALAGEAIRDLRIRIFLPARGRDASVRIDAEPLRAADGAIRAVIAAVTEVVEHSASA